MATESLIHLLMDEANLLDELLGLIVEQRESVKKSDHAAMQDTMKRVQDVFFRIKVQEAQRTKAVESVSAELGCKPTLSALAEAIPAEERALFVGAGERLGHFVFELKSEMAILSGLIEQNERFSAMLLSEWRRLDTGFMRAGGLDFRG